ncbi:unnamed protein product [Anisakis simplex]|uniref:Germline survival defective-1 (inferred by orthology to a C. elegans protein) n=1 Tax=Anisakis simplex TaxID=6269 RepID=A0A0M3JQW8_ANISI|nr:unnamed protein product [Anisakis simplex]
MVGRKKRSNSTRNHFVVNNTGHTYEQEQSSQTITASQHQHRMTSSCYETSAPRRGGDGYATGGSLGSANGTTACHRNGTLAGSDSENSTNTITYRRRSTKQFNNHHLNIKDKSSHHPAVVNNHVLPKVNGSCKHRSGSQEAGSASAGSVVSGPDLEEDGSLSGSGMDFDPDDSRFVEKRDFAAMTDEMAGCSVATQTSDSAVNTDFLLGMCKLKRWQRVEAIGELVQCLNAHEQRYLGCCIEAAIRSNSSYLRQYEIRWNDAQYIQNFLQTATYRRLLEHAFPILSLLHSTNRQAAAVYLRLLERLYSEFEIATVESSFVEKERDLDALRLAVSASLYHPAFSIEHKMKLEMIRNHLDAIRLPPCSLLENQACPPSSLNQDDIPIVISRLDIVSTSSEPDPDVYSIEVEWSDRRTSYVVKTADQIADLHNRLLDDFPNEAGAQTENPRLALPDLPARVLVCPIMREFFYTSRFGSSVLSSPPQSLISLSLPSAGAIKQTDDVSIATVQSSVSSSSATSSSGDTPQVCVPQQHPPTPAGSAPVTLVSVPVPVTTVCPPVNILGCSNAPLNVVSVPPPPRGIVPLVPTPVSTRPMPLITAAGVAYPPLMQLPPNPNGLVSCCNCAGLHSFTCCPQPTMLQIIANGYQLSKVIADCMFSAESNFEHVSTPIQTLQNKLTGEYKLNVDGTHSAPPSDVTRNMVAVGNTTPPPPKSFSTPPPTSNSH